MTPGARIRTARLAAGISGSELARQLGVAQPTMVAVEQGRRSLPRSWLERLEYLLGIDPAILQILAGEIPDECRDECERDPERAVEALRGLRALPGKED